MIKPKQKPAVWLPAVRTGTGTDVFTIRLAEGLRKNDIRAEITWLPHRAEYAPWTVPVPSSPAWANVVHVNTWLHPRFIPEDLPVVATLHHSVHHPDLEPYKGWLRSGYHRHWIRPVERATMRRAERVVAVSHFAAKSARATLLDRPMGVIPNGVDIERFRPPPQRAPHQPFRLLYVGSWMARKGVDLLAPIMRQLGDDFELHYTGGPDADKDRAAMPSNTCDIGHLTDPDAVVAAMNDTDAFLFPSRSEGFGLVVAEAMACGLPVIATRGSSIVELMEDGVTGILCSQDRVASFVETVRNLAKDSNLMSAISSAARDKSVTMFAIDRVIEEYVGIYRQLTIL